MFGGSDYDTYIESVTRLGTGTNYCPGRFFVQDILLSRTIYCPVFRKGTIFCPVFQIVRNITTQTDKLAFFFKLPKVFIHCLIWVLLGQTNHRN